MCANAEAYKPVKGDQERGLPLLSIILYTQERYRDLTETARIYRKIIPEGYQYGPIHDHQEEFQIYIASLGHRFRDQHLIACPRSTSSPTSKEVAGPSRRSWTQPHGSYHVANRLPTALSYQHLPEGNQSYLVSKF